MRTLTLRMLRCALIACVLTYISMFGWRFWGQGVTEFVARDELREALKTHVRVLSHDIGDRSIRRYDNLIRAQHYIYSQFESFGYDVRLQTYTLFGKEASNVIAEKKGAVSSPLKPVIVGAHYDTCDNPGADDNASGVAGLLEIARAVATVETRHPVRFIAFVNEEPPFFKTEHMGSRVYARSLTERGEGIETAIILESIGYYSDAWFSQRYPPILGFFYPNKANFIIAVGNRASRKEKNTFFTLFKQHSRFPIERTPPIDFIPAADFSDHWSFWKEGFSAFMITGTAFLRNKSYHAPADTHETLHYPYMAEAVHGIIEVIKNY